MLIAYWSIIAGLFITSVSASAVPRATTCKSISYGYLETFVSENSGTKKLDVSSNGFVTYGNGTALKAHFESCPELGEAAGFKFAGRLVTYPEAGQQCLTIVGSSPAYYIQSKPCTSNTKPEAAQQWGFGDDFGDTIFATGIPGCDGEAGLLLYSGSSGKIKLSSTKKVEIGCPTVVGSSYESLTIIPE